MFIFIICYIHYICIYTYIYREHIITKLFWCLNVAVSSWFWCTHCWQNQMETVGRLITSVLPKTFLLYLWTDLMGTEREKNKDLLFFTVTQSKCRLSTGSICRFQIFCGPLLLFLAFRSNLSPSTELDFHVLHSCTNRKPNPLWYLSQSGLKTQILTSPFCSHFFMWMY